MLQTHFLLIHFRASIHGLLTLLVSSQEYLLNVLILLLQIQYLGAVHRLPCHALLEYDSRALHIPLCICLYLRHYSLSLLLKRSLERHLDLLTASFLLLRIEFLLVRHLLLQIQYLGAVHLLPSCARSHCLLLLIARRSIARLALRHRVSQHSLQRMQLVRQQLLLLPRLLQPIAVLTRS